MAVIADLEGIESEKGVSLGELIQVEEKFFANGFAFADSAGYRCVLRVAESAMVRILLAFDRFGEVEIPAQTIGDGKVGLEDAPAHLLIELFLEFLSGLQNGVAVG